MSSEDSPTPGKGRPTPKRSAAQASRKAPIVAPRATKEQRKTARENERQARADARAALMAGDERYFPARDRGPVRQAVRDHIDSRRTVGEVFLPIALIIIVGGFATDPTIQLIILNVWLAVLSLVVIDTAIIGIRLHFKLKREFPSENRRGSVPYAVLRALQLRKLRVPPPRVRPGGKPITPKSGK